MKKPISEIIGEFEDACSAAHEKHTDAWIERFKAEGFNFVRSTQNSFEIATEWNGLVIQLWPAPRRFQGMEIQVRLRDHRWMTYRIRSDSGLKKFIRHSLPRATSI